MPLWVNALERALGGEPPLAWWWDLPAIGQLTITRPELLRPFAEYNRRHPEGAVGPSNFVAVAYPKPFARAERLRLIAPLVSAKEALEVDWYDVHSGAPVRITTDDLRGEIVESLVSVKSYGDVAREHVARPERKFESSDGCECLTTTTGLLRRRRVLAVQSEYLGKEGNLLDQRVEGDGVVEEAQQVYESQDGWASAMAVIVRASSAREIAHVGGISERAARDIRAGRARPRAATRRRLEAIARSLLRDP